MTPFFINIAAGNIIYFFIHNDYIEKVLQPILTMSRIERKTIITLISIFFSTLVLGKNIDITVTPSNWWTGMKNNTVTLIANAPFSGNAIATINYPGVKLIRTYSADNTEYLFIEIEISNQASPGKIPILFRDSKANTGSFEFQLSDRIPYTQQTLTSEDIIYQIVPDRFCNGDTKNDKINGYFEVNDRLNPVGVHGGDLAGISTAADYITNIGFTCVDLLPVFESNLMTMSYQRDGITDNYKVDQRLGNNSDYINLVQKFHQNNLKVIKTMVLHQLGKYHPWSQKPPYKSFFHKSEYKYEFNHQVISTDPYSSEYDKNIAFGTWQELNMPVLNQSDKNLQSLLIQNCIWWIETSNADVLKIDEINRNTPEFLKALFTVIHNEYPNLSIVSDHSPTDTNLNFWQEIALASGFNKQQVHITDYPVANSLADAFSVFNENNEGLQKMYSTLTQDHKYLNPFGNIVMADNHQLSRLFSNADKELDQSIMMLGYVLTTRGIPSVLYGTEWLLDGSINKGKGFVRKDFPGGWEGDSQNGFEQKGFSPQENEFYNFAVRTINWRNKNKSLFTGKFIQFAPEEGTYAYYRQKDSLAAFVFINNTEEPIRIDNKKYIEILGQYSTGYDIVSESTFDDFTNLLVEPKSILILHLKK